MTFTMYLRRLCGVPMLWDGLPVACLAVQQSIFGAGGVSTAVQHTDCAMTTLTCHCMQSTLGRTCTRPTAERTAASCWQAGTLRPTSGRVRGGGCGAACAQVQAAHKPKQELVRVNNQAQLVVATGDQESLALASGLWQGHRLVSWVIPGGPRPCARACAC